MIIELNFDDQESSLAGLDFCLSALAMEQPVSLLLANFPTEHKPEKLIESKLEMAKNMGLEAIFFKPLAREKLRELYSENEKVVCF